MRTRLFNVIWMSVWPLRVYITRFPFPRGKGFLTRRLLIPLLPPAPAMFPAASGGEDTILLQHRETVGLSYLMRGTFESVEIESARQLAADGTWAFDVGAHVGLFSIPLSRAVGSSGAVVAFEPLPDNARRLRENLARNTVLNVRVWEAAASHSEGEVELRLANDSAFTSTAEVFLGRATGTAIRVPSVTLDRVWQEAGQPQVAIMKVDVEGAELDVLSGGRALISACSPAILVEVNTGLHLTRLTEWLGMYGYIRSQPAGFMPWNYLFLSGERGD